MQTDYKEIYRLASEKNGISEQIYKDLGGFVFSNLAKNMKRPKSLIIKLKGVGSWYMRKKRMEDTLKYFPEEFDKTEQDFETDKELLRFENKKEIYKMFKDRLKDYEEYITLRDEVRKKRYETQKIIIPSQDKS